MDGVRACAPLLEGVVWVWFFERNGVCASWAVAVASRVAREAQSCVWCLSLRHRGVVAGCVVRDWVVRAADGCGRGVRGRRGVIPRVIEALYRRLEEEDAAGATVRASYIELYREDIRDLLSPGTPSKVTARCCVMWSS